MNGLAEWVRVGSDRSVLGRAVLTALVVGSVLTLITRGDLLSSHPWTTALTWQTGLLYLVPFLVSTWSSVAALRRERAAEAEGAPLLARQIEAINRFPDQNPNPVMRVTLEGEVMYANLAGAPILTAQAMSIGAIVPDPLLAEIREAADHGHTVEVRSGVRTFALLPVHVPEFDFLNVYGTDVTAAKVVTKFPDQNPNPVLRMSEDGTLIYANAASGSIAHALGVAIGEPIPPDLVEQLRRAQAAEGSEPIEIQCGESIYVLKPVLVEEFGFTNIYGTDVTAARQIERLAGDNERLLLNILPASIAERLRGGETLIADRYDELTVLFADCVGFTEMSSRREPREVVDKLNRVFSVFDGLADRYGLEKIKTIGDAYMVAGGLLPGGDYPERVAAMGLDMLTEVKRLEAELFPGLEVRLGMHVGPAVAGVIGLKKFIYDVWGDTVNVASRMESMGVAGRMQVAESTYRRLRGSFEFEARGTIDVKGLGPTATYFVTGRRSNEAQAGEST